MHNPHLVMQQRLSDMTPLMFGDTLRLPIFQNQSGFKAKSKNLSY
jgi:hypothetical protein